MIVLKLGRNKEAIKRAFQINRKGISHIDYSTVTGFDIHFRHFPFMINITKHTNI